MNNTSFHRAWLVALLFAVGDCLASESKRLDEVLFVGWGPHNHDSLYYLPSEQAKVKFERYWRFKNLKTMFGACGYSYDVFKSNTMEPVRNIASVNIPCGTVEVNGGTYFGQLAPVWKALKQAKTGSIHLDTLYDSALLVPWLSKKRESPRFLGFKFLTDRYRYEISTRMPMRHDSTSPINNDTIESFRKFYADVQQKSNVKYEKIFGFRVSEDSIEEGNRYFKIRNSGDINMATAICNAGYEIDTTRIGVIIRWFSK